MISILPLSCRPTFVLLSLVLFVGLPPSASAHALSSDTTDEEQRWTAFTAFGAAQVDIVALNQQLSAAGYPTFTSTVPSVGGGISRRIGDRFVLGGEGHFHPWGTGRSTTNRAITLRGGYALATLGYRLRPLSRLPGLSVYPQVGGGGGALRVQLSSPAGSVFELLQAPASGVTFQRWSLLTTAEVTIAYHFLRDTPARFRVGLRLGYLAVPTSTAWRLNGARLSGRPASDLEGPFLHLVLGRSW